MKTFVLLSMMLFLLGCATTVQMYKEELPNSEIAELKVPNFIKVEDFDGMPKSYKMSGGSYRWVSTTSKILPGHHYIVAHYGASAPYSGFSTSSDSIRIEFDALPGRKYELRYEFGTVLRTESSGGPPPLPEHTRKTRAFRMWIEEATW